MMLNPREQLAETAPRQGKIDERFKTIYDKLSDIRNHLERLTLTQAWSLRETDLYNYQRQLDQVDESRINGNFEDPSGYKADLHAQRVSRSDFLTWRLLLSQSQTLLYLLRRSYAYIYSLIIASEPVSEALLPIFNQLQTLRRCLIEVKRSGGVSSPRELYPYSMKVGALGPRFWQGIRMLTASAIIDRQYASGREIHGWGRCA